MGNYMTNLTNLPVWKELLHHYQSVKSCRISDFFAEDSKRLSEFSFRIDEFLIDFSLNRVSTQTKKLLLELAKEKHLEESINDLFSGKHVNFTENRPALHMILRVPDAKHEQVATQKLLENVIAERARMYDVAKQIREGSIRSSNNKQFTDIVMLGVGGSMLGPQMLYEAFSHLSQFKLHFISGMDGEEINALLKQLDPQTSLFIIASKSFTTLDTLSNAKTVKDWLSRHLANYKFHLMGISENEKEALDFGIPLNHFFKLEKTIGGRYSVWSAVSLGVVIALGPEVFDEFLSGGYLVDQHFKNTEFNRNVPVLLGLLDIWYDNFFNWSTRVILPYSFLLKLFPFYLQQLEMESCGKQVNFSKELVDYQTGPIIWGDVGFVGQHSFYQLLQQGTQIIPADFIIPVQTHNTLSHHKNLALANALAQIQALSNGKMSENKFEQNPGNRPMTLFLFPKVTPKILGMLIALYEHKVFTKSVIWEINPFDQYGVELGKQLAKNQLSILDKKRMEKKPNDPPMFDHILEYVFQNLKTEI